MRLAGALRPRTQVACPRCMLALLALVDCRPRPFGWHRQFVRLPRCQTGPAHLARRRECRARRFRPAGLNLGLGLFEQANGSYGLRNIQTAPALGLRAFSGDSQGFVAAVTWTGHRYERSRDNQNSFDPTARLDTVTLTVGWRFRAWPGWFLEAAVGAGIASTSGHPDPTGSGGGIPPFPFRRETWVIPDLSLGVGFEF